jgi:phytoene synthase
MNESQALADYLPQPGSDLHYALLYAPRARQRQLALIEALRGEIARVPANCSNPAIAATKLAWWREELARLADGAPRHALTRALQPALAELPSLPGATTTLVDAVAELLDATRFPSREARFRALDAAHGPLWEIVIALCAPLEGPALLAARRLGSRIEEAYALRDMRRFVGGGLTLLAQDSVQAAESFAAATALDDTTWYARVVDHDLLHCIAALREGLAALPARRALRPLATLARIATATLEEVRADGSSVWDRRIELTPLRKLWLAWRERSGV